MGRSKKLDEWKKSKLIFHLADCFAIPNWFGKEDVEIILGKVITENQFERIIKLIRKYLLDFMSEMFEE